MTARDIARGYHSHRCRGCRTLVRCQAEERAVHCPPSVICDDCFASKAEAKAPPAEVHVPAPLWVVSWGTMVALVFADTEGDAIGYLRDARGVNGAVAARRAKPEDQDWWERAGGTWPEKASA